MSYRTVKRLLGETSLERKCRFLFGGGLMLLISGSFYFYAHLNSKLVLEQSHTTARLLLAPVMLANHSKYIVDDEQGGDPAAVKASNEFRSRLESMAISLKPDDLPQYSWTIIPADPEHADATSRPFDDASYQALEKLREGQPEVIEIVQEKGEYRYYKALRASQSCINCHNNPAQFPDKIRDIQPDELMGMAKITFPLDRTNRALAWNNAILLATAIVTAFLAMLAAYAIVRYVIVKPVLYLKDVSDEIARGNLELRADIQTGDEFEELSHAFNRMLRHLVTVQDELRQVNRDLDGKVDELAQVNLQLYEMNKLKDDFLATMSHELRTPLNSILGFSDVLSSSENLSDRQQRYLRNIQTSGKDLMALINDLLDLAKIESGKMDLQLTTFSAGDLIERQVTGLSQMAEQKNIDLTWSVDAGLPVLFQDAGKMQQVLNNLLSNAIKFTPQGGRVHVRAGAVTPEQFEIAVEDTGVGIPLEDQEKIFEKFRQGRAVPGQHSTLTREYGGTGLGLSIVKELCKLLGGEISLESEFGKGSLFTVRLPVRLEERLLDHDDAFSQADRVMSSLESRRPARPQRPSEDNDESAA